MRTVIANLMAITSLLLGSSAIVAQQPIIMYYGQPQLNQLEQQRRQAFVQQEIQRAAAQLQAIQLQNQMIAQQARNQQLANQSFQGVQPAGYYRPAVQPGQAMGGPNVQPGYVGGPQFTPDYRLAGNIVQGMTGVDVNQKQREAKQSWDTTRKALGGVPTPPVFKDIARRFGW